MADDVADAGQVEIPAHVAGGEGPLSALEAARSLTDWRRKQGSQAGDGAETAATPPAKESEAAPAAEDGAPPETEAPAETQEIEPAPQPPIEPPRSWTKEAKDRWQSLPRETQEYLAQRETERDRATRQSQNEAAEQRKAIEAERVKVEQARQQYESALPVLLQQLMQQQSAEFADIKTQADLEALVTNDPARYLKWDLNQRKIQGAAAELAETQRRAHAEQSTKYADFAKRQDELFAEKVPEFADKDKRTRLETAAVEALKETGFTDDELVAAWNGQGHIPLRDHRMQLLIRDAVLYRDAKAAATKATAKPVPQVQRPGVAQGRDVARNVEITNLDKAINSTSGTAQLRNAARLIAARRAAR